MPVAVVIIAIFFFVFYAKNIRSLIDRFQGAEVGGVKLTGQAQPQTPITPADSALPQPAPTSQPAETSANLEPLPLTEAIEAQMSEALDQRFHNNLQPKIDALKRALAIQRVLHAHEFNYRVIFGTQLQFLKALNEASVKNTAQAQPWYDEYKRRITDGAVSFEDWLSFLTSCGYIEVAAGEISSVRRVDITALGRDFLIWMVSYRVSEVKPF